jgi:hypothetical protein
MNEEEKDVTAEEYRLLALHGFHETKGMDGVWQRGRVHGDVDMTMMYSLREALAIARREEEEGRIDDI